MDQPVIFPAAPAGHRFPTTRSQGRTRRIELEEELTGRTGVLLILDFQDVDAMTISYADEFLAKFLATFDGGENDIAVVVQNLNAENVEAVHIALDRRNTDVVMSSADGGLTLLGDQRLGETFEAANTLGSFKAVELAKLLKISPQNANNRLKPLVEMGALRKSRVTGSTRGGKEFVYSTVKRSHIRAQTACA